MPYNCTFLSTHIVFFTAAKFADVQKEVADLIKDRILIGHSISTDLKVSFAINMLNLFRALNS